VIRRGDIWWAELPAPRASEPGYRRPVLVVQANDFNQSRIATVLVVMLTSNLAIAAAPGNVLLRHKETKLPKDSVANVSQVYTLDKAFLVRRVGPLSDMLVKKVEGGLKLVLSLES
jgi:mRNA interferase MazF